LETPKTGGRCRQAQPVIRTNSIAQNTARSSALGMPPPCARFGEAGNNGSVIAHSPSGTRRLANSSTQDLYQTPCAPTETHPKGHGPTDEGVAPFIIPRTARLESGPVRRFSSGSSR
jgi:hypothetical protein